MKTMKETTSATWTKLAEIETTVRTHEEIYEVITAEFGEEFFELDEIEGAIKDGWIELCEDGIIVWADMH